MKNQNIFVALGWYIIKKSSDFLDKISSWQTWFHECLGFFFQMNTFQKENAHKENVQSRNIMLILAKLVLFCSSLSQLVELFS